MKWEKKGLIFEPPADVAWMASHAAAPVGHPRGGRWRIHVSGRDALGRARIGAFEIDPLRPEPTRQVSAQPTIDVGPLGAFDDGGAVASCIVAHEGRIHHYYTGWTAGVTVPFYLAVGLAVSDDGGDTFRKVSAAPVLDRSAVDPYLTASPCVLIDGGVWRMWYVSGSGWTLEHGRPTHYYHIRYAESRDGLHWTREGVVCIDYSYPGEHAISRPCVVKDRDMYRMWYAHRGAAYRIGYAESRDGIVWARKDEEAGIDVSPAGWDADMVAYPWVFDHDGRRYMLYNGNGYGRTGVGLAVCEA